MGAGRSGTTLLQLILNAHPKIAIIGELHFFDTITQIRRFVPTLECATCMDEFIGMLERMEHYDLIPSFAELIKKVHKRLNTEPKKNYETFFRYLMEEYAISEGAQRFGEKTPENVRYLDELIALFPKAKIVHLIRDPRAVIASSVKMPNASENVLIHALSWKYDIVLGRRYKGDASYLEVRYEDLVRDCQTQLNIIVRFVGEKFAEEMLTFHDTAENYIKNEPWKLGTQNPVYKQSLEKWRKELSQKEITLIEFITGKQMRDLGYKPEALGLRQKVHIPLIFIEELTRYGNHLFIKYLTRRREQKRINNHVIYSERKKLRRKVIASILKQ